jgi:hypothetical protein
MSGSKTIQERRPTYVVVAGLVPAIHVFHAVACFKT